MAFDIKAAQALMLNEEFNRKVDNVIAAKSQGKRVWRRSSPYLQL